MAKEAKLEKKPWWVSPQEMNGLRSTPQENMADSVVAGVPDLNPVERGDLVGAYVVKDGILIYHFYKADRKKIYDDAHKRMEVLAEKGHPATKDKEISRAAQEANAALEEVPWWPDMKARLTEAFDKVFRDMEKKISYYQEADSWSVILPEPPTPLGLAKEKLERPFDVISSML